MIDLFSIYFKSCKQISLRARLTTETTETDISLTTKTRFGFCFWFCYLILDLRSLVAEKRSEKTQFVFLNSRSKFHLVHL